MLTFLVFVAHFACAFGLSLSSDGNVSREDIEKSRSGSKSNPPINSSSEEEKADEKENERQSEQSRSNNHASSTLKRRGGTDTAPTTPASNVESGSQSSARAPVLRRSPSPPSQAGCSNIAIAIALLGILYALFIEGAVILVSSLYAFVLCAFSTAAAIVFALFAFFSALGIEGAFVLGSILYALWLVCAWRSASGQALAQTP